MDVRGVAKNIAEATTTMSAVEEEKAQKKVLGTNAVRTTSIAVRKRCAMRAVERSNNFRGCADSAKVAEKFSEATMRRNVAVVTDEREKDHTERRGRGTTTTMRGEDLGDMRDNLARRRAGGGSRGGRKKGGRSGENAHCGRWLGESLANQWLQVQYEQHCRKLNNLFCFSETTPAAENFGGRFGGRRPDGGWSATG